MSLFFHSLGKQIDLISTKKTADSERISSTNSSALGTSLSGEMYENMTFQRKVSVLLARPGLNVCLSHSINISFALIFIIYIALNCNHPNTHIRCPPNLCAWAAFELHAHERRTGGLLSECGDGHLDGHQLGGGGQRWLASRLGQHHARAFGIAASAAHL